MNNRTPAQTALLVLGALIMLGGVVCVVIGFAEFADSSNDLSSSGGEDRSLALFAGGGFAAVVGFGIVAFTRASILTRSGAYTRVTIEQGAAPSAGGKRFCASCGRPSSAGARFCESCGVAIG